MKICTTGHSRTIVGIEELKDGSLKLLIFDPSCSRRQMNGFVNGDISGNLMKSIRRTLPGLKARQYQIVAVVGVLADREYEVRVLGWCFDILQCLRYQCDNYFQYFFII